MLLTDPHLRRLMLLAKNRQATALRPGTKNNHRSILMKFIKFNARCGFHFYNPPSHVVCMFIEECLQSVRTSSTIKNYISALSSCYLRMGLNPRPFYSFKVRNAILSVDKNVRHTPSPSRPVSPGILRRVIQVVRRLPEGTTVAAALILMYHTFYRGSNFAAESSRLFDSTRHLTRDDVVIHRSHLNINHKWSKSHQSSSHQAVTRIPAIPGSKLCPRHALINMLHATPTRYRHQPLLVFKDGNHMPLSYIRKVWNSVVSVIKLPRHHKYTLHGLRRGAATHIINHDPSARDDIKRHGLWRSRAVDLYLPPNSSKVFKVMKETL